MLLFPRPFPRAVAFCNASPKFVAQLEECHGLSRGTDIQIYRPFRFTWKRYLKMLGSDNAGSIACVPSLKSKPSVTPLAISLESIRTEIAVSLSKGVSSFQRISRSIVSPEIILTVPWENDFVAQQRRKSPSQLPPKSTVPAVAACTLPTSAANIAVSISSFLIVDLPALPPKNIEPLPPRVIATRFIG